ncbi:MULTISPECIES: acetyltransferase [Aeromonas]|uniref:Acetyltransferase n=2 Tax=Bacteria TaxID=2 RepID=A0AAU6U324_UNCXX|nr:MULTISPECIES: acetyltransferase [Aeromonas]MDF8327482.1 acetyltransferase [Aeromonas salmonicida]MDM5149284.1 acetyltransferase [Aeromonas salmonicida]
MTKCAILGASGHGKVIAEIAELNNFNEIHFFDDRWPQLTQLAHWSVFGNSDVLLKSAHRYDLVVVAIGHNATRVNKLRQLQKIGAIISPLVHPNAVVSRYASLGAGTVVMANTVVNPFASVGEACILNTAACIEHDCVLADGVHISPGAKLAGGVNIGLQTWVGIGAQIKQLVSVGDEVVVGAGATVIRDVPHHQIVVGTPARAI